MQQSHPNEETEGLKGFYQKLCHKMNRRGFQYIVGEDALGRETITIFNPDVIVDQKQKTGLQPCMIQISYKK